MRKVNFPVQIRDVEKLRRLAACLHNKWQADKGSFLLWLPAKVLAHLNKRMQKREKQIWIIFQGKTMNISFTHNIEPTVFFLFFVILLNRKSSNKQSIRVVMEERPSSSDLNSY